MKPGHHVILILAEKEWALPENQSNMEFDEDLEVAKKVVTKVKDELGEQVERNLSKIGKINLRSHSE